MNSLRGIFFTVAIGLVLLFLFVLLFMPTTPTDGKYVATAVCQGSTEPMRFSVYDYPSEGSHNASIEWIKIEKGNVATDWSPAPEDATEMEQRIYYRSSSSTAPTAPSSWVTATTTANATWTTKRMSYDRSYPYLWTCIQRKTGSNIITNSTVLLDDTTTVIDGGNIITGSVAANKISVTDLEAFGATIGGLTIANNSISSSNDNFEITSSGSIVSTNVNSGNTATVESGSITFNYRDQEETSVDFGGVTMYATSNSPTYTTFANLHVDSDGVGKPRLNFWHQNNDDGIEYDTEYDVSGYAKEEKEGTSTNYSVKKLTAKNQSFTCSNKVYVNSSLSENYYSEHTAGTFRLYESGIQKANLNALGVHTFDANGNEKSRLTNTELKINTHDLLRMSPHFAQMFATEIPANANLNTTTYLKVGQYYCQTTYGFTNSPTGNQFVMEVTAMIYNRYDDESETEAAYRVRKITDYIGNQFIQYCSKPTSGNWSYGTWQKIITGADSITELTDTGNITTSTSMAYTGKSLTLPSAGWWAIEGYANYSNSAPIAIAINREVGSYYYELAYAERHGYDKTVQYVRTSCVGYYDANSVIKLFARYSGANSNGVGLTAKKLH